MTWQILCTEYSTCYLHCSVSRRVASKAPSADSALNRDGGCRRQSFKRSPSKRKPRQAMSGCYRVLQLYVCADGACWRRALWLTGAHCTLQHNLEAFREYSSVTYTGGVPEAETKQKTSHQVHHTIVTSSIEKMVYHTILQLSVCRYLVCLCMKIMRDNKAQSD